MVPNGDSSHGPFADLSPRDRAILQQAQQQGRVLDPLTSARIEEVVREHPQTPEFTDEAYEVAIISELRLKVPPLLLPHPDDVGLFLARWRAARP